MFLNYFIYFIYQILKTIALNYNKLLLISKGVVCVKI